MSLHVDRHGSGAPLVLLHGWGMHGGIWNCVVAALAQSFRVYCVDLPGHGKSKMRDAECGNHQASSFGLDSIVDQLSGYFPEPLTVCGWSLGGMVALRWARLKPQQVQSLVLVASTPCFGERKDWPCGMAASVLQQFASELARDHAATLRRFLALQLRGGERERELLADLRATLFSRGEPALNALRAGLEILRDADLRAELIDIVQPALVIAGTRDKLTPPQASFYMAEHLPNARVVEIPGAAHAPFLSHPQIFIEQIRHFLHG